MGISLEKLIVFLLFFICGLQHASPHDFTGNPILPGYFSNPSVIQYNGLYYLFGTNDPEGDKEPGIWVSGDFINWEYLKLNWKVDIIVDSDSSSNLKVRSPKVILSNKGHFYMYFTVSGQLFVAVSDKPEGPWTNAIKDNHALLSYPENDHSRIETPYPFVDDDGIAYLYWIVATENNNKCLVSRLKKNFKSISDEIWDITPDDFVKSPMVIKKKEKHYLLYTSGDQTDSTSKIKYLILNSPVSKPLETEAETILSSSQGRRIFGPGHSFILQNMPYDIIIYDRLAQNRPGKHFRQICAERISFMENGGIEKIEPGYQGIPFFLPNQLETEKNFATWRIVEASSSLSNNFFPYYSVDHSFKSLWVASKNDTTPYLFLDMRENRKIHEIRIFYEFPNKVYNYLIEYSTDKENWNIFADKRLNTGCGSPVSNHKDAKARYIKIQFLTKEEEYSPGIWEIEVY